MEPQEGKKHNITGKRENSYSVDVYNPAKRHKKDRNEQNRHHRHERSEGRNSWAGFEDSQNPGRTERSNSWSACVDTQSFKSTKRRDSWSSSEDSQTHKRHDSYPFIRNNHNTRDIETDTTRSTYKAKQSPRSPERYGRWPTSKDGRSRKRSDRGDSWSASEYNDTRRSSSKRDSWTSSKDRHTTRSSGGRDSWSPITNIKPTKRIERRDYNLSDNNRNSSSSRTLKRHSWPTSKDNQTSRRYDTANDREFEFFWKSHSPFSQWHLCDFTIDGITFNSAEQYMMHSKATLFEDEDIAYDVLRESDPREQKRFGRLVRNFNLQLWEASCSAIVERGNKAKFSQDENLKRILLDTYPKTLVEASPYDVIWGIGLEEDDPMAWDCKTWRGQNLLGKALTKVRDELKEEKKKGENQSEEYPNTTIKSGNTIEKDITDIADESKLSQNPNFAEENSNLVDDNKTVEFTTNPDALPVDIHGTSSVENKTNMEDTTVENPDNSDTTKAITGNNQTPDTIISEADTSEIDKTSTGDNQTPEMNIPEADNTDNSNPNAVDISKVSEITHM